MNVVTVENHGPLIVATDYWRSEAARAGKLFVSCNAGAIRILIPNALRPIVNEMRTAKVCVLSRGPWPAEGKAEGVEILFDDGSDSPFALHLGLESFDLLPAEPEEGQGWLLSAWDEKKGKPHKALERRCHWRRVENIPCLKPWEGE